MRNLIKMLLVLFVIFIVDVIINFERTQLDGKFAEVSCLFYSVDTRYSANYSDKKFSDVKIGMTFSEVVAILGEPISRFNPHKDSNKLNLANQIAFQYSYSPSNSHFRVRNIIFDNGVVIKKVHSLYIFD